MPTKSTRTRMDDHLKDHNDTEEPRQRNHPKQSQTHKMPTNDAEDTNNTNKGRDLLLANKPWFVPDKQKGCCKGSEAQQSYFTWTHSKWKDTRRKNLAMAWIDYKKAYYMVLHSWIINCLKIYNISHEVINFIDKTMKTWWVELIAEGRRLAKT